MLKLEMETKVRPGTNWPSWRTSLLLRIVQRRAIRTPTPLHSQFLAPEETAAVKGPPKGVITQSLVKQKPPVLLLPRRWQQQRRRLLQRNRAQLQLHRSPTFLEDELHLGRASMCHRPSKSLRLRKQRQICLQRCRRVHHHIRLLYRKSAVHCLRLDPDPRRLPPPEKVRTRCMLSFRRQLGGPRRATWSTA